MPPRKDGTGMIPQLPPSIRRREVTPQDFRFLEDKIREIITKINGGIEFGSATLNQGGSRQAVQSGNMKGEEIIVKTPGVSNTVFPVLHSLGYTPKKFLILDRDGQGVVVPANRGSWNNERVYFRVNQAGITLVIWLG